MTHNVSGDITASAVDYTPMPAADIDRAGVTGSALLAAGVGTAALHDFADATDLVVAKESMWNPNAIAILNDEATVMADGAPYPAQRGLTQLTPWAFAEYHVAGTSSRIYDPVANIAAAWQLIADVWDVNLHTGQGLPNFVASIRALPGRWFGDRPA